MALLESILDKIPEDVKQDIVNFYPDEGKRNFLADKVILSALTEMIKEQKKQELLDALTKLEKKAIAAENNATANNQEKTSVEMIRELRGHKEDINNSN